MRFAAFALADAFAGPDGPTINLGDFFYAREQASGEEEAKMAKTVNLMRRIVAHELHHVGFGAFVKFPGSRNADVRGGGPAFLASYNRAAEVLHLAPVIDVSTFLLAEGRR